MEIYLRVIKEHYFDFEGRARRQEYWMFVLFNLIASIVLAGIDSLIGTGGILGVIYSLAVLCPSIGVAVRRLHDIGKSGWFLLLAFIPLIGAIILIIWFCQEGERRENMYGPDPKGITTDANSPF